MNPTFAPMLKIPKGVTKIDFYTNALGAVEHFHLTNDDGSIHVAEFSLEGAIFHLHEETIYSTARCPGTAGTTTVVIGLFVEDVHAFVARAEAAGATVISPVQDYDYGYRQGTFVDPFGHHWQIQKKI